MAGQKNNKPIAIFLPSLEQGGAERRMVLFAIAMQQRGYRVEVLVLRKLGTFEQMLEHAGITIRSVDKKGKFDLLGALVRTRAIFKRHTYKAVFSCLPSANIFAVLIKTVNAKTPLIWGLASADMPMDQYGLWAKIGARVQQFCARYANKIIVNSFKAREVALAHGFNEDKMQVVHNGVNTEQFILDKKLGDFWRKQLKIPANSQVIGMVARLDPAKGVETFLQAAELAYKKGWYFLLFGSGTSEYAKQLKASMKSHTLYGKRLFLIEGEPVDSKVYNAFNVATISSVSESFPNVMLEAMSCGVPVVSTDVGDCSKVINSFGKIVPINNTQAMLNAWESQLNQKLGTLGADVIREYIINEFSISRMVDEFEHILVNTFRTNSFTKNTLTKNDHANKP